MIIISVRAIDGMVFSSLIFLLAFLPLNLICYFCVGKLQARNVVLLVFSLIFYAWGEPVYVLILLGMSFASWWFSQKISAARSAPEKKRWLMWAVIVCLGTIGIFKYTGFFVQNLNLLPFVNLPVPQIGLPIGISFYTFQLLTYVVDVYRGDVPAQKYYWKVLLYAGLFHQCVAGPIVRYGDIENELTERRSDLKSVYTGTNRFIIGLAKKSVLANSCGALVDALLLSDAQIGDASLLAQNLATLQGRSALTLWMGMAFYMLQIYLDFSAYSDMAIGMGLICGLHYKENFRYPYTADSITDFWRRWHISLGTFFRDYVYIPLGGNRQGQLRTYLNMFIVWALTGLWHGASWNFVLWGLYFFVFLVLEKAFLGKLLQKTQVVKHVYLIVIVFFGWIFFRFTKMPLVTAVFSGMFCHNGNPFWTYVSRQFAFKYLLFFILCCVGCTPLAANAIRWLHVKARRDRRFAVAQKIVLIAGPCLLLILSVLALVGDSYNPFLYFQF